MWGLNSLATCVFSLKESFNGSTRRDSKDGTGSLLWPLTWDMLSPWWASPCGGRDANNNVINAAESFCHSREREWKRDRERGSYKRQKARSQLRRMAKVLPDIWVEFSFGGKENAQQWQNYIDLEKNKQTTSRAQNSCLPWLIRVSDVHAAGCSSFWSPVLSSSLSLTANKHSFASFLLNFPAISRRFCQCLLMRTLRAVP